MTAPAAYLAAIEAWKSKRLADLKAPAGWLNLVGRWWLSAGMVSVGSGADNDLVLPVGPERLGTLTQSASGAADFVPADGSPAVHLEPSKKNPPKFLLHDLLLELTTINGENALRVRDTRSTAAETFPGFDYFDVKPEWRIVAAWVPLDKPVGLTVDTTKDIPTEVEVTHQAVFENDGRTWTLIATHGTPERPQFVFRDLTSRDATYPACRFVYGEEIGDGRIVLDFNKAINPPCAFTEHAVCPLPPAQNVLPFRIEAGEKRLRE